MQSAKKDNSKFWILFSKVAALSLLMAALAVNLFLPKVLFSSDFASAFWIAGEMLNNGQASLLYPNSGQTTFIGAPFDLYTHERFQELPKTFTALFMYSPLTALLFVPFSFMPVKLAMLSWQIISILALALSAWLFARTAKQKFSNLFFLSLLFMPIFHALSVGQITLVCGLLPMYLSYYCISQNLNFWAGICFAFLILKPQFLPVAGFVSIVIALVNEKRLPILAGILLGMTMLIALTFFVFSPALVISWLKSLQLSDAIYSSGHYAYNEYMMSSLQASLLQLFPQSWREWIKIPAYIISFTIAFHALLLSIKLMKTNGLSFRQAISFVFVITILTLPLIVPHFVFYDLSAFVLAGMIIYQHVDSFKSATELKYERAQLEKLTRFIWISINIYFLLFAITGMNIIPPIVLTVMLFEFYRRVALYINSLCNTFGSTDND
jgi:hypothetical protein